MQLELTLKELQIEGLNILIDVHRFCENREICYSLAYGTLLGAIRHKGFIPWDDDVDIIMPRNDFERFLKEYSSEQYMLISPHSDDSFLAFARVCDVRQTVARGAYPWCKRDTGVWIDVFPADGVSDSFDAFSNKMKYLEKVWSKQLRMRSSRKRLSEATSFIDKVKLFGKKILYGNINIHEYNEKFFSCNYDIEYGKTSHWSQMACLDGKDKEFNNVEDFNETELVPFEGHLLRIMKGFDGVLKNNYGDYMKLPPVEEQVPKQSHVHFYWNNNKE